MIQSKEQSNFIMRFLDNSLWLLGSCCCSLIEMVAIALTKLIIMLDCTNLPPWLL